VSANVQASPAHFSPPAPAQRGVLSSFFSSVRHCFLGNRRTHPQQHFVSGYWERLTAPAEDARLMMCARLLRTHTRNADVLEIGCGEADLMRHLTPDDYSTWTGIDASTGAIDRARRFGNERVRYVADNLRVLEPGGMYDAIIFSESIYYLPDPAAMLHRYARHLKPDGVLIISLFENGTQAPVWRDIHSVAYSIGSCVIQNARGIWTCEALRMRRTTWHMAVDDGQF
jgi:2-polyprenyl-3-methyl-5-hydroxy-6-metoxy-1,4-benzoquinol methylase